MFPIIFLSAALVLLAGSKAEAADGKVETQVQAKPAVPTSSVYGSFELQHHNNYFFDSNGRNQRQEPSAHVRLQLGYLTYADRVDLYSTIDAYKLPNSLEVNRRKPEFGIDLTLIRQPPFQLVQYSLLRAPGTEIDDGDSIPFLKRLPEFGLHDGSEIVVGFMPSLSHRVPVSKALIRAKCAVDMSSFLYTQDSWVKIEDKGISLISESDGSADIRDAVPRYHSVAQFSVGAKFEAPIELDWAVFHDSLFAPQYFWNEDHVAYHYVVDRMTRSRLRIRYELNEQVSIIEDFSAYYEQFFGAKLRGEPQTYRNVLHLSVLL